MDNINKPANDAPLNNGKRGHQQNIANQQTVWILSLLAVACYGPLFASFALKPPYLFGVTTFLAIISMYTRFFLPALLEQLAVRQNFRSLVDLSMAIMYAAIYSVIACVQKNIYWDAKTDYSPIRITICFWSLTTSIFVFVITDFTFNEWRRNKQFVRTLVFKKGFKLGYRDNKNPGGIHKAGRKELHDIEEQVGVIQQLLDNNILINAAADIVIQQATNKIRQSIFELQQRNTEDIGQEENINNAGKEGNINDADQEGNIKDADQEGNINDGGRKENINNAGKEGNINDAGRKENINDMLVRRKTLTKSASSNRLKLIEPAKKPFPWRDQQGEIKPDGDVRQGAVKAGVKRFVDGQKTAGGDFQQILDFILKAVEEFQKCKNHQGGDDFQHDVDEVEQGFHKIQQVVQKMQQAASDARQGAGKQSMEETKLA